MPQRARKDPLEDLETLVAGLREAATRPVRMPLLAVLESTLDEAREIQENREIFRAATKDARQSLSRVLRRGRDIAVAARNYLKAYYGPYNAELTRFGIQPIRRGTAKKTCPAVADGTIRKTK